MNNKKLLCIISPIYPSVGGVETLVNLLIQEWLKNGYIITVLSPAKNKKHSKIGENFEIYYKPNICRIIMTINKSDYILQMNASIRLGWPCFFKSNKTVLIHNGIYFNFEKPTFSDRLKMLLIKKIWKNISVSEFVANKIPKSSIVINNPYNENIFKFNNSKKKNNDIAFVGRLVSEKGAHILMEALKILESKHNGNISVSIIGDGPDKEILKKFAANLTYTKCNFLGYQNQNQIAEHLSGHKIVVIPSICDEGFGIIALEALACGCIVIASNSGGLPEAIGRYGVLFKKGDSETLSIILDNMLKTYNFPDALDPSLVSYLKKFNIENIANSYISILNGN